MDTTPTTASETTGLHVGTGFTAAERLAFEADGYLLCRGLLAAPHLDELRDEFDRLWAVHGAAGRVFHQQLLTSPVFIRLIEHPPILDRHRALFGEQTQLLSLDLLRQGPESSSPDYGWHRDFHFPGDHVLAANTILYLDDLTPETGQTRVVPGTHRGHAGPPAEQCGGPLPGEVALAARAGDAALINAALWHTGGRNRSVGQRRVIYLYYGWWWLKQYFTERGPLPWQAAVGAGPGRLSLLGQRMPGRDLHMY